MYLVEGMLEAGLCKLGWMLLMFRGVFLMVLIGSRKAKSL